MTRAGFTKFARVNAVLGLMAFVFGFGACTVSSCFGLGTAVTAGAGVALEPDAAKAAQLEEQAEDAASVLGSAAAWTFVTAIFGLVWAFFWWLVAIVAKPSKA